MLPLPCGTKFFLDLFFQDLFFQKWAGRILLQKPSYDCLQLFTTNACLNGLLVWMDQQSGPNQLVSSFNIYDQVNLMFPIKYHVLIWCFPIKYHVLIANMKLLKIIVKRPQKNFSLIATFLAQENKNAVRNSL